MEGVGFDEPEVKIPVRPTPVEPLLVVQEKPLADTRVATLEPNKAIKFFQDWTTSLLPGNGTPQSNKGIGTVLEPPGAPPKQQTAQPDSTFAWARSFASDFQDAATTSIASTSLNKIKADGGEVEQQKRNFETFLSQGGDPSPIIKTAAAVLAQMPFGTPAEKEQFSKTVTAMLDLNSSLKSKTDLKPETVPQLAATLRSFKPEVLKDIIGAGLDPKLTESQKSMITKLGVDLLSKIPSDKDQDLTSFALNFAKSGLDPRDIFSNSADLAKKLGMDTAKVADAQKTLADSALGLIADKAKEKGLDLDKGAIAVLLDPAHPDSIVDKNGNIDKGKLNSLSKQLANKILYNPQTPEEKAKNQEANSKMETEHQATVRRLAPGRGADPNTAGEWNPGTREFLSPIKNYTWGKMDKAYNATKGEAQAQRDQTVAAEIKGRLESAFASIKPEDIKLAQGILAQSSLASSTANVEIEKKTQPEDDPQYSYYKTSDGEYRVYNANGGIYNYGNGVQKPLVYKREDGKAVLQSDDFARNFIAKANQWNTSIASPDNRVADDENYHRYVLNNGTSIVVGKEGTAGAGWVQTYDDKAQKWTTLNKGSSAAQEFIQASNNYGKPTVANQFSNFAPASQRLHVDDLLAMSSLADKILPDDMKPVKQATNPISRTQQYQQQSVGTYNQPRINYQQPSYQRGASHKFGR